MSRLVATVSQRPGISFIPSGTSVAMRKATKEKRTTWLSMANDCVRPIDGDGTDGGTISESGEVPEMKQVKYVELVHEIGAPSVGYLQ